MKTGTKVFLIIAAMATMCSLITLFALGKTKTEEITNASPSETGDVAGATTVRNDDYIEELAKYLSQKGMVLYGSSKSDLSKQQKDLFEQSAQYLDYVECDSSVSGANSDECIANKIESYPTWIFEGKYYSGVKELGELAEVVGFSR